MIISSFIETIKSRGLSVALSATINVVRLVVEKHLLGKKFVVRNIHDYKMYLDASDMGLCRSLILFGTREVDHKILLEKIVKPGMTILDIGANIGYYALMELGLIGSNGKLIAVEPSPRNIDIFQKNLPVKRQIHKRRPNNGLKAKRALEDLLNY